MQDNEKEIPISITIPVPTELPHSYGIEATSGPNGCFIQCRGTTVERERIKLAAQALGIPYGTFMRRVVNDAASFIIRELELTNGTDTEDPGSEGEEGRQDTP